MGYVKFDGGVNGYFKYLNEKNWSESISKVELFSPSSYGNVFWDTENNEEWRMNNDELSWWVIVDVDELPIDGLSWLEDDRDIFDPEFQDEFEEFFAPEEGESSDEEWIVKNEELDVDVSGFGFVDGVSSKENSGVIAWEETELSDNKKSILKLLDK